MKTRIRNVLRQLVRYLGPRVGLAVFELAEHDTSPEATAFLLEEIETPPEWLTVTLH